MRCRPRENVFSAEEISIVAYRNTSEINELASLVARRRGVRLTIGDEVFKPCVDSAGESTEAPANLRREFGQLFHSTPK